MGVPSRVRSRLTAVKCQAGDVPTSRFLDNYIGFIDESAPSGEVSLGAAVTPTRCRRAWVGQGGDTGVGAAPGHAAGSGRSCAAGERSAAVGVARHPSLPRYDESCGLTQSSGKCSGARTNRMRPVFRTGNKPGHGPICVETPQADSQPVGRTRG